MTLHRGLPTHFDDLRDRYRDGFPRFARTHGFLLFELVGHLTDGLQAVVRGLGDRIDELRMAAALPGGGPSRPTGPTCSPRCSSCAGCSPRTRDLLSESRPGARPSCRRRPSRSSTTSRTGRRARRRPRLQPGRAGRGAAARRRGPLEAAPAAPAPAPGPATGRPPIAITSLGGFEVRRAGVPLGRVGAGRRAARELLAALLSARRPVPPRQLVAWLWPGEGARAGHPALADGLNALRRALDPQRRAVLGRG